MKPRKLTLISLTLLTLLVVGTVVLIISTGQEPLIADQVKFIPKHIDMQNTGNLQVEIKLFDAENNTVVEDIDDTTVRLESIGPINTWVEYNKQGKPEMFVAEFAGSAVKGLIWSIISHMGLTRPNPWVPMPLRLGIAGELNDDTPWEGSAIAVIENWAIVDPPPPPPP
jgi:hypothetical protein